jgi:1,4-dihydroxy-2-naphthoate polyprenyltransferase
MPSMKSESRTSPAFLEIIKIWVSSSRPKTLIASISPVIIGSSLTTKSDEFSIIIFICCVLFSLTLQIATNWANDYYDYMKGTDRSTRKGPIRPLQIGQITPNQMKRAFQVMLILAALITIPLLNKISWSFLPWMLGCLSLAILYTGGKYPLGYLGWGDFLVFTFYGPVACSMSAYAQLLYFPNGVWIASLIPGAISCALLCINNLRDCSEDREVGKMTLVARCGENFGKWQYTVYLGIAALASLLLFFQSFSPKILLLVGAFSLAKEPILIVWNRPQDLNRALALTAKFLGWISIIFVILYAVI